MLLKNIIDPSILSKFNKMVSKRSKESLFDFPKSEIKIISNDILTIVKKYPSVEKIWMAGSYVNGGHVKQLDDYNYLNLRKKLNLKTDISDRDYITHPQIIEKIEDIDLIFTHRGKKILIFANGFNLFEKKQIPLI